MIGIFGAASGPGPVIPGILTPGIGGLHGLWGLSPLSHQLQLPVPVPVPVPVPAADLTPFTFCVGVWARGFLVYVVGVVFFSLPPVPVTDCICLFRCSAPGPPTDGVVLTGIHCFTTGFHTSPASHSGSGCLRRRSSCRSSHVTSIIRLNIIIINKDD